MEFPFDYFLARVPHQLRPARASPLDLPQNLVATPSEALVTLVEIDYISWIASDNDCKSTSAIESPA